MDAVGLHCCSQGNSTLYRTDELIDFMELVSLVWMAALAVIIELQWWSRAQRWNLLQEWAFGPDFLSFCPYGERSLICLSSGGRDFLR